VFEYSSVYAPANTVNFASNTIFALTDDIEKIDYLQQKCDYVALFPRSYKDFYDVVDKFPSSAYLVLPQIARNKDLDVLEKIAKSDKVPNVIAENLYALELFKDKNVILGSFLNVLDDNFKSNKILSIEGGISKNGFTYAYGRYPIMTFSHCPKKTIQGSCKNCNKYDTMDITDERGNQFSFRRYEVTYCYSHLLNSIPVDLSTINAKNKISRAFLDLSGKDKQEIDYIIDCFKNGKPTNQKGMTAFCSKNLE
jgi:hypothetical protein